MEWIPVKSAKMNEGIGIAPLLDNWHNSSGDDHILEVNRPGFRTWSSSPARLVDQVDDRWKPCHSLMQVISTIWVDSDTQSNKRGNGPKDLRRKKGTWPIGVWSFLTSISSASRWKREQIFLQVIKHQLWKSHMLENYISSFVLSHKCRRMWHNCPANTL